MSRSPSHPEHQGKPMRKLIAGLKVSLDGKVAGPTGIADWVDAWSEDYDLTSHIDACVLGRSMYPGYEAYWTAVQNAPDGPSPITGKPPTPGELEWGRFASRTAHYVLSNSPTTALWQNTGFLKTVEELAVLKQQQGKHIYLVGGAGTIASLLDAGLIDEIRLIVYPLVAGEGTTPFETTKRRHALKLLSTRRMQGGRVWLNYELDR
jgi:dihydrofolate reductase